MVLHGDEFRPLIDGGNMLVFAELPGPHGGCTDIADSDRLLVDRIRGRMGRIYLPLFTRS